ncbi:uncharacterized protein KY384_002866 [Bacidia gigantensis]|uniref:uncharacterized protein n=1 Tax=Bacidia gigantensis TaxID=2732470 RepID=UPI001D042CCC|nr:uncharacterized protein KY384_002866 [Bacidia gigantensis]KAG8532381.1 hypothetical protein KY384_002866 [Bacidia gigantensis]
MRSSLFALFAICNALQCLGIAIKQPSLPNRASKSNSTIVESTPIYPIDEAADSSQKLRLAKRQGNYQRRIENCPEDAPPGTSPDWDAFYQSSCTGPGVGEYDIECLNHDHWGEGGGIQTFHYSCRPGEFCLDGGSDSDGNRNILWDVAICVSYEDVISLARDAKEPVGQKIFGMNPTTAYPPASSRQEVVLSTQQKTGPLYVAKQISLQAQDATSKPLGPPKTCGACSRLDYDPWPQGTDRFVGTVQLAKPQDEPWVKAMAFHHDEL